MKTRLMFLGIALVTMVSTRLKAQVTPVPPPTIVPIVGATTNLAGTTRLIARNINLSQGQIVHLFGRLEFASKVGTTQEGDQYVDYVGVWLECIDPNGNQALGTQDNGENYLGPAQTPGPNYPTTGEMVLYPSALITAATPGTYSCQMLAAAVKPGWVVGRDYQGGDTTWLGLSAPIQPHTGGEMGAFSWTDAFSWAGDSSGCFWKGPNTDADHCLYLGPSAAPSVDVFSSELTLPGKWPGFWSPAPDAAFVDVTAVLQLSLCGKITQCAPQFRNSDTKSVTVNTYLELDQLDETGKTILHKATSPVQESTIGNFLHHDMIVDKLTTAPVYPSGAYKVQAPKFQLKFFINWVSGSTAKVDGVQAVAVTSYHGNAPPIPNVIGLTGSAASNTLSGSGYAVSVVSNSYSTSQSGSVIAQDPLPGIIELPGAAVNLTLSTGSVNVPKVTSLTKTEAQRAILSLGLVPVVVTQPGCLDPGVVLLQSPKPGKGVSPGFTVSITVDSGTTARGAACAPN